MRFGLKRMVVPTCLLAASAAAAWYGAQTAAEVHAAARVRAFTMTSLESSFAPDGAVRSQATIVLAQREDGSRARIRGALFKRNGRSVFSRTAHVYDLTKRQFVSVYDLTRSTITTPLDDAEAARLSAPPPENCVNPAGLEPVLGPEESEPVLGYRTIKVAFEIPASPGGGSPIRVTQWRAPELGCVALREEHQVLDSDGNVRYANIVREAVAVSIGAPPAEYFAAPADYVERKPSAQMKQYYQRLGRECAACMEKAAARADDRYLEQRRRAGWQ